MPDLSALTVRLEAEISNFTAGINNATSQLQKFAADTQSAVDFAKNALAALGTVISVDKILEFSDDIVKSVGSLHEMSQAVGLSTEALSQLQYAAKLEGIDDIATPIERLARSSESALQGNQKLQLSFQALGISMGDLRSLSTDQLMMRIATAVSGYGDSLQKTNLIQQLFGRGSADMIAFLNQGAAGIQRSREEAEKFGLSIGGPAAEAAHQFEQDITRLKAAFTGAFEVALGQALPSLNELTRSLVASAQGANALATNASTLEGALSGAVTAFKVFATAGDALWTVLKNVGEVIGADVALMGLYADAIAHMPTLAIHPITSGKAIAADADQARAIFKDLYADLKGNSSDFLTFWDKMWGTAGVTLKSALDVKIDPDKLLLPSLQLGNPKDLTTLETAIDALAKYQQGLEQQVATYGLGTAAAAMYNVEQGKLADTLATLDKMGKGEQAFALKQIQLKLDPAMFKALEDDLKSGMNLADAFRKELVELPIALEGLKSVDSLQKLDEQILKLTGHADQAAAAAFQLTNRPLQVSVETQQDRGMLQNLDSNQRAAAALSMINDLRSQAAQIEGAYADKVMASDAAMRAAGASELQIGEADAVTRQQAIAQLQVIYDKTVSLSLALQSLGDTKGAQQLTAQAQALRQELDAIQLKNAQQTLDTINQLKVAQGAFNDEQEKGRVINEALDRQLQSIQDQLSKGSITTLDAMAKEDDARTTAIAKLRQIYDQEEAVAKTADDPAMIAAVEKFGEEIDKVDAQVGQLAKTMREDLVNDATSAFTAFETGAESGRKAIAQFTKDIENQILSLVNKKLFEGLFSADNVGGATGFIQDLGAKVFGGPSSVGRSIASADYGAQSSELIEQQFGKVAPLTAQELGLGGSGAGAAAQSTQATGITTALSTGSTTLSTAIDTSLSTGGTTLASAITEALTTGGETAAQEIAAAMQAGGGVSSATGGGLGASGLASLFGGTSAGTAGVSAADYAGAYSELDASTAADLALFAAATGGSIPVGRETLVGEKGPELFVADAGMSASSATAGGTEVPADLSTSHVIGAYGPEVIRPDISGIVIPSDKFVATMTERAAVPVSPIAQLATAAPGDIAGITSALPLSSDVAAAQAGIVTSPASVPVAMPLPTLAAALSLATPLDAASEGATPAVPAPAQQLQMVTAALAAPEAVLPLPPLDPTVPHEADTLTSEPAIQKDSILTDTLRAQQSLLSPGQPPPLPGAPVLLALDLNQVIGAAPQAGDAESARPSPSPIPQVIAAPGVSPLPPPLQVLQPSGFVAPGTVAGGRPVLARAAEGATFDSAAAAAPRAPGVAANPPASPPLSTPVSPAPAFTTIINGVTVPLGLAETFTTDSQGRVTINEGVSAYVGQVLPAGTTTASGGWEIASWDIDSYPAPNPAFYSPDYLASQPGAESATFASYAAQFSAAGGASGDGGYISQITQPTGGVEGVAGAAGELPAGFIARYGLPPGYSPIYGLPGPGAAPPVPGELYPAGPEIPLGDGTGQLPATSGPFIPSAGGVAPAGTGDVLAATSGLPASGPLLPPGYEQATAAGPLPTGGDLAAYSQALAAYTQQGAIAATLAEHPYSTLGDGHGLTWSGVLSLATLGAFGNQPGDGSIWDRLVNAATLGGAGFVSSTVLHDSSSPGPASLPAFAYSAVGPYDATSLTSQDLAPSFISQELALAAGVPLAATASTGLAGAASASIEPVPAGQSGILAAAQAPATPSSITLAPEYVALQAFASQPGAISAADARAQLAALEAEGQDPSSPLALQLEDLIASGYLEARAAGGPVTAGFPYLVGEEGAELMVPNASGTIVPNDKLGGLGGGTVNNYNTFIVQQNGGNISRASQIQAAAQIARLTSTGQRNM